MNAKKRILGMGIVKQFVVRYNSTNIAVKASLWFTICSIVQKGISVITMPLFTRLMSTAQYGKYNIFLTWYNVFMLIITLNVHAEIFNKGLIDHTEEKDLFTSNQAGLIIALTCIGLCVYLLLRSHVNSLLGLTTPLVVIMLLEILGSSMIALWSARKRFDFDYIKIVQLTLATSVLTPLLGVAFVFLFEQKAEAKIISNAIVPIVVSMGLVYGFIKKGKIFSRIEWWRISIIAALPLLPHYLSLVLLNQSDKIMINAFCGPEEAAIYSVAHSAGLLMTIVNNSINGSFVPWAYGRMKDAKGAGINKVASKLALLVMVVNVTLIWIAPEAISILAAPQYAKAVYCLIPIAISVYFYFIYTSFVDIEIYYGANNYVAIASIIAAVLNLVLNYLCIPRFGFLVAGYTTLISYFVTMLLHYLFLKRILKKKGFTERLYDMKKIIALGGILIALSVIAALLYHAVVIRALILVVVVVVVVVVILYYKRTDIHKILSDYN